MCRKAHRNIYPFLVTFFLVQKTMTILHCIRVHSSSDAIEVVIFVENVIHRPSEPKKGNGHCTNGTYRTIRYEHVVYIQYTSYLYFDNVPLPQIMEVC
jgi:hypothetical protein